MIESNDIARLAGAINHLRPDWPQSSLYTFIARNLSNRGLRDVAVALAWVATDPATDTPKRVLEAGPWWQAAALAGASTNRPPRADETCRWHPAHYASDCAGCRADQLAGEERPPQPGGSARPPKLDDVRAKIRANRDEYHRQMQAAREALTEARKS